MIFTMALWDRNDHLHFTDASTEMQRSKWWKQELGPGLPQINRPCSMENAWSATLVVTVNPLGGSLWRRKGGEEEKEEQAGSRSSGGICPVCLLCSFFHITPCTSSGRFWSPTSNSLLVSAPLHTLEGNLWPGYPWQSLVSRPLRYFTCRGYP